MEIIKNPPEAKVDELLTGLRRYNRQYFEISEKPQYLMEQRGGEAMEAGLLCTQVGQWMELDFFWIREDLRGKGLGIQFMEHFEALARELGCRKIALNTFSFQARPFYEKLGFRVVYTQENYPVTNTRYFMEKDL